MDLSGKRLVSIFILWASKPNRCQSLWGRWPGSALPGQPIK